MIGIYEPLNEEDKASMLRIEKLVATVRTLFPKSTPKEEMDQKIKQLRFNLYSTLAAITRPRVYLAPPFHPISIASSYIKIKSIISLPRYQ